MSSIIYTRVTSNEELKQILQLQHLNIPSAISENEKQEEGFVTVNHNFKILKLMNDLCAHTIAKYDDKVVGYALSMVKAFKNDIEVLQPMFQQIDNLVGKDASYIVMGQVCVDKNFRKQGVFRGLYEHMKSELYSEYDTIITEVDKKNIRSLNAHYAIGFKVLYSYRSNNQDWEILSWDIKITN
jgi:ribosomal protein S18 acetylase RimI-like enzyme